MTSLFKFGSQNGKRRSLLALFILHSLHQDSKSGYDLLKEIGEKTNGMWIPSKGTIYPLLHQMERDRLISVQSAELRSRKTYWLTSKGEETLSQIRAQSRESHRKTTLYKNLIQDIFRSEKTILRGLLLTVESILEEIPPGYEGRAAQVLENCLTELKELIKT
jgi:DNA-binding PadR family transcriptional regulator